MIEIASRTNHRFKRWLSLTESKGIRKEQCALLSGAKLTAEFLNHSPARVAEILLPPKASRLASELDIPTVRLSAALFQELDVLGTRTPMLVIHAPKLEAHSFANGPNGLELVVALSDPSNLGACLRSAEAFGVSRVILTREASSPFLPRALRASSGAALRLNLSRAEALHDLKLSRAIGLDMNGEDLKQFRWPNDAYLVLGQEGLGLPNGLCQQTVAIPMAPPTESLNASVAAAIALYSYRQQIDLT